MKISKIRLILGVILITSVLSGCITITSHLFAVRKQVCEFDEYFSVGLDREGLEVKLNEPILLEREVLLMVGATPTSRVVTADGMTASYIFEQVQTTTENLRASKGEEFELRLLFISSKKGFLLSGIQSSEVPAELFDSALTVIANSSEMAREACDLPINPFSRSVVVDVDRDMLDLLPARQSVISWLGPPSASTNQGDDLIYEFRLKGESNDLPVARIDAGYGRTGDLPVAIDASFSRYHASIDVPAGTMRVKFHF